MNNDKESFLKDNCFFLDEYGKYRSSKNPVVFTKQCLRDTDWNLLKKILKEEIEISKMTIKGATETKSVDLTCGGVEDFINEFNILLKKYDAKILSGYSFRNDKPKCVKIKDRYIYLDDLITVDNE